MSIPNASRSNGTSATTTVELLPWQLAEIRRQLYIDLMGVAEHVVEEANRASQMSKNDGAQRVLGEDLRAFVHSTFADAVELLDRIGWDVNGDTDLLIAHGLSADAAKGPVA